MGVISGESFKNDGEKNCERSERKEIILQQAAFFCTFVIGREIDEHVIQSVFKWGGVRGGRDDNF